MASSCRRLGFYHRIGGVPTFAMTNRLSNCLALPLLVAARILE
jgi:hypothetical protein